MSPLLLQARLQQVAAALRIASPAEVGSHALDDRVERKFLLPASRVPALLEALGSGHSVLLANGRSFARYESVYLDTAELRAFDDHRMGRRPRQKLRFRHYLDRELTVLERKAKGEDGSEGGVTCKARLVRPYRDEKVRNKDLRRIGHRGAGAADLLPTARTRYARLTLLGGGADAHRLTVDVDLTLEAAGRRVRLPQLAIVELKEAAGRQDAALAAALDGLGGREVAFSKYCAAQIVCGGQAALGCLDGIAAMLSI